MQVMCDVFRVHVCKVFGRQVKCVRCSGCRLSVFVLGVG